MTLYDLLVSISLDTSQYDQGMNQAEGKAKGFGSKLKTAAKVGVAAVAAVGTATIAAGVAIAKATSSVAQYGDNIDKMSQKMGISAEKYQEWDAVMRHSGTSMETMKTGMKTLANAAEKGNKAFERIGLTQQEVARMSQEELFEATIAGLQNVENSTERTYLAGQLLGRGATELGALLNTSAEDTQKMKDRVHELGGVMSDEAVKASAHFQDTLQDLQTSFQGVSRGLISQFLPGVSTVMEGLTDIIAGGDGEAKVQEGVDNIIDTVGTVGPKLFGVIGTVGSGIISAIGQNLPTITQAIANGALSMVTGMVSALPSFISATGTIISTIITSIGSAAPQLLSAGLQMVSELGQGLVNGIPQMVGFALSMVTGLVSFITANAGQLIAAGADLVINLGKGLLNSIPVILAYIPQLVSAIWTNITTTDWVGLGTTVMNNLLNGLEETLPKIVEAIKTLAKNAIAGFKSVDWKATGKSAINFLATAMNGAGKLVLSVLKIVGKTALNAFKGVDWKGVGKTVITFIGNAIKGAGGLVLTALKTAGSKAVQGFKSINWVSLGTNIISGIVRGIGSAAGSLFNKLKGIASNALGAAKKALKIESPSKVFEQEVGKNIVLGWAKGISENAPKVESALADVNDGMYDAFASMGEIPIAQDLSVSASPLDLESGSPMGTRIINFSPQVTVNGAEDPEDWADRFVRRLRQEVRMA